MSRVSRGFLRIAAAFAREGLACSPLATTYCKVLTDVLLCKVIRARDRFEKVTGLTVFMGSFVSHFELAGQPPHTPFLREDQRENDRGVLFFQVIVLSEEEEEEAALHRTASRAVTWARASSPSLSRAFTPAPSTRPTSSRAASHCAAAGGANSRTRMPPTTSCI